MGRGRGLTKVFVGNLSFKTKEADLVSEFESVGKVVSANIITRGPRSLGYGFVELETEDDAKRAVELMNKKSIDSREINVEVARPRDETKITEKRRTRPRGGRGGRGGGGGGGRGGGGRGGRGGRGGFGRGAGRGGASGSSSPAPNSSSAAPSNNSPNNSPNNNNASASPNNSAGGNSGRGGRGGRGGGFKRQNSAPRTPSKTTLFVANLPFALEDQGLTDLFKDLKVVNAYVVKNRNDRSKGFGFVEFNNEDDQKAALTAAEKFEVDKRKLIVKIALTGARRDGQSGDSKDSAPSDQKDSADDTKQ